MNRTRPANSAPNLLRFLKSTCLALAFCAAISTFVSAQTFTALASLGDGFSAFTNLIPGRDGNLYGSVIDSNNASYGHGAILKVTPSGTLTVLHYFCSEINCRDGLYPVGTLVLGTDGNFYGVAAGGGITNTSCTSYGCGLVFKITPAGLYSVLHFFNGSDGNYPSGLIEGVDRNFYGTTRGGGSGTRCNGCGTVFKMSSAGLITTLHNFNESDGFLPTGLVQGTDDDLYGTTSEGGQYTLNLACENYDLSGCGTVFKTTTDGAFTLLHSFDVRVDGADPYVPVTQANDGTFYGTTYNGKGFGFGTIFNITPDGAFETAYQFYGDAFYPTVGLSLGSDGSLYGTMGYGPCGEGFIYSISEANVFSTVYNCGETGGFTDGVVQATSGKFYGTFTTDFNGEIYSLDTGLGPFVAFVLPAGKRGQSAQILGQGLTGTTSVTFNGVPATSFTAVSDTYMTAVVPTDATTGPVVVTTLTGTLTSNKSFRIIQ